MAAATACLKWVDVLENQFDKSWVDMDLLFNEIDEDEEIQIGVLCRKHASSLASCFSQLVHKATVIFQTNAKLEAQLLNLREEMAQLEKAQNKLLKEKNYLTHALVTSLAENHKLRHPPSEAMGTPSPSKEPESSSLATTPPHSDHPQDLQTHLDQVQENLEKSVNDGSSDCNAMRQVQDENEGLRQEILELQSELVGARLDNVYLDKELAGRIQQIQILASGTPSGVKERLWTQIEGEMCLQRSKTIAQICKSKQALRTKRLETSSQEAKDSSTPSRDEPAQAISEANGDLNEECSYSKGKQVSVLKNPADDLGMAIIGGKEHNLPIIISEVFPNSAVHRSNKIQAGDVILSVNGQDFSSVSHEEAVTFLSSLRGQISFKLLASETVCEDDPSNLDFRFYRIFDPDHDRTNTGRKQDEAATGSKKSPVQHPGRAVVLEQRANAILSVTASPPQKGANNNTKVVAVDPAVVSPVHQIHPISRRSSHEGDSNDVQLMKKGGKQPLQDGGLNTKQDGGHNIKQDGGKKENQDGDLEKLKGVVELHEECGSIAHV